MAGHRGAQSRDHGTSSSWSPSDPVSSRPTLAAQQASTFQRISDGRLLLNIVTGGDADEQRRFGDWLDHDRRYDRTAEFITVLRGAWSGEPFHFHGEHFEIAGATTVQASRPTPEIFFGGASPAAERVAAPPRRRLPRLGGAAQPGGRARRTDAFVGRSEPGGRCGSASDSM